MAEIKELDVVLLLSSISAVVIGESRTVLILEKTKGTVVLVHEQNRQAAAFEVEFSLGANEYALATIPYNQVALVSAT